MKSGEGAKVLVLGILGILCCGILAPVAWVFGNKALREIDAGAADPSERGLVTVGRILGIVGTVLIVLQLVWIFGFGGLAILSAIQSR
ncbi:MAG: DUF4190 domain-containing protein [Fimbriimonadaceae bacterium]